MSLQNFVPFRSVDRLATNSLGIEWCNASNDSKNFSSGLSECFIYLHVRRDIEGRSISRNEIICVTATINPVIWQFICFLTFNLCRDTKVSYMHCLNALLSSSTTRAGQLVPTLAPQLDKLDLTCH